MLELRNEQLVRFWLSLCPNFLGAVYFSDSDELMVLNRRDNVEPLLLSPLKYQLDRCLVYLDQAHTRGTDLKLPLNFRATITLGSKVTKDRLVQGKLPFETGSMPYSNQSLSRRYADETAWTGTICDVLCTS